MNYLFGYLKIPQDFTVSDLLFCLHKIEKEYEVNLSIERFRKEKSTFYLLKLYSRQYASKVDLVECEKVNLIADGDLNIYKGKSISHGYIHL